MTSGRNGWWVDYCQVHGETSFNTIVDGCEACAQQRLTKADVQRERRALEVHLQLKYDEQQQQAEETLAALNEVRSKLKE